MLPGSDMVMSSAWEDQTEANIRERAGRRKHSLVRSLYLRSKRMWSILVA